MRGNKAFILLSFLGIIGCASQQPKTSESNTSLRSPAASNYDFLRGNPGEYDPGAPKDSKWVELFANAPNYREVGKAILGGKDEKFRWEFGPMWYRGRLGKDQVKVFVVGQEGAQDENVSNRAFTGSTGTKTQSFLNHIGIYRSYLFLNTFVYTINGQLDDDPKFEFMEQGTGASKPENSPIVSYRHQLFDNMLVQNQDSIALFMGVGAGGKASLATWINARGGKCNVANDMDNCDTTGMVAFFNKGFTPPYGGPMIKTNISNNDAIKVIGVPHPGGASAANGGAAALENIVRGFTKAANKVAKWKKEEDKWLPQDKDDPKSFTDRLAAMNSKFQYKDAGIPYRDFAFGTNYRMGYDGTTSNRWKADSIQVFSNIGIYGDKTANYRKESGLGQFDYKTSQIDKSGFRKGIDMPWEPPKAPLATAYDPGPCGEYDNAEFFKENFSKAPCDFADALASGWPKLDPSEGQSTSFGPTSIYRGRPANFDILVIADQTSHDDFFSGRALTGETGQRLQTWLTEQKVGDKYLILRTSPWDSLKGDSLDEALVTKVKDHFADVVKVALKNSKPKKIVGLGSYAQKVAKEIAGSSGITYENIDVSSKALLPIPRVDLPFHSRWWMGTSGNRAIRGDGGELKPNAVANGKFHYYRVYAPVWNSQKDLLPKLDAQVEKQIADAVSEIK